METGGSLPSSEQPVTCPCIQPDESNPTHFNIVLQSTPRFSKWSSSIRFPHQSPVCPRLPPPPHRLHAPPISFFDLITRIIIGEENRPLSSSVACYLARLRPQLFSSVPYSRTPSEWETKFHVYTKQQPTSEFCVFQFLGFWVSNHVDENIQDTKPWISGCS
jgi:hypothetical protein